MNSPTAPPGRLLDYAWPVIACIFALLIYTSTHHKGSYDEIPAVGGAGFFSSYISGFRYLKHATEMIQEGYDKYHPGIFRIPELTRWHLVVTGEKFIEEFRKTPDDIFSFRVEVVNTLASKWTFGANIAANNYHVSAVRNQLTRNLGQVFGSIREEAVLAFEDYIPATENWTPVKAPETVMKLVSRVSNRVFLGSPTTCRDPEYIALTIRFAMHVIVGAGTIGLFPTPLKPLAGRFLTKVPTSTALGAKYLRPIIEERQRLIDQYGYDYPGKSLDMLSWLMDDAQGDERTVENLTRRILLLNFAAIHTSSLTFTYALFELASRPEYMEPLREEVETIVAEHGWTKVAMTQMRKLDSFMKETQRFRSILAMAMGRRALKEFTFSDGTRIPKGSTVSVSVMPRHMDNKVYPDADTFNGFRFSELREEESEGLGNRMSTTSADFLSFGHGRHACPGRFFAINELKAMMAHVIVTYDLMMTSTPPSSWFGVSRIPDSKTEVLFRRRSRG